MMKKNIHTSGFHEFLGRIFCLLSVVEFFPLENNWRDA